MRHSSCPTCPPLTALFLPSCSKCHHHAPHRAATTPATSSPPSCVCADSYVTAGRPCLLCHASCFLSSASASGDVPRELLHEQHNSSASGDVLCTFAKSFPKPLYWSTWRSCPRRGLASTATASIATNMGTRRRPLELWELVSVADDYTDAAMDGKTTTTTTPVDSTAMVVSTTTATASTRTTTAGDPCRIPVHIKADPRVPWVPRIHRTVFSRKGYCTYCSPCGVKTLRWHPRQGS
ncbi:hypothetical protein BJ912DRAFT_1133989, partial [Pholiota molesta]